MQTTTNGTETKHQTSPRQLSQNELPMKIKDHRQPRLAEEEVEGASDEGGEEVTEKLLEQDLEFYLMSSKLSHCFKSLRRGGLSTAQGQ